MREKNRPGRWIRLFKFSLITLLLLGLAACLAHQPRPRITESAQADALARKVMDAVGDPAWRRLKRVVFTFRGKTYDWRVPQRTVWFGDAPERLIIDLKSGTCRNEHTDEPVSSTTCTYRKARWNNDSFWLHPFGKFFDPGAERSLCYIEEGAPPWLCVRFGQGGNTPGDLYAIEVGPDGRPSAWRMWVKILPVGGVHNTWADWKQHPGGVWFAQTRDFGLYTIPIEMVTTEP